VPALKVAVHVPGQEMPLGELITEPEPLPVIEIVRVAVAAVLFELLAGLPPPPHPTKDSKTKGTTTKKTFIQTASLVSPYKPEATPAVSRAGMAFSGAARKGEAKPACRIWIP
jgi:hypothetical protein